MLQLGYYHLSHRSGCVAHSHASHPGRETGYTALLRFVQPVGRADAFEGRLSTNGSKSGVNSCYSYSRSRGLYLGVALEGSVFFPRDELNRTFYNDKVSANWNRCAD